MTSKWWWGGPGLGPNPLGPGCWAPLGRCPPSLGLAACCLTLVSPSRVHITEATLNHLDKAYEVEDGHGQQRDPYLKEMNIRTYLVIDPRVRGSDAAAWGCGRGAGGPRGGGRALVEGRGFPFKAAESWGETYPGLEGAPQTQAGPRPQVTTSQFFPVKQE